MCRLLMSFKNKGRELQPFWDVWDLVREKARKSEQIFVLPKSDGNLQDFWFCPLSFAANPDN